MASSSRSKKAKTTNPLDLSRLLKDDDQKQKFLANFIQRPVLTPKYGSLADFESLGCNFPSLIRAQGLHVLVEDHGTYCPDLIRAFYCNLDVKNNVLHSWVKGKTITMTIPELAECLSIPCLGAELGGRQACPWEGFHKREFYFSLCRFSEAEISRKRTRSSDRETLGVGNLTIDYRLLHYFLVYVIYQKGGNYGQLQELDLKMMYGCVNMESINWAFVIMYHMLNVTRTNSPLPYAFQITRILKKFHVDFSIELPVQLNDKDNKIDQKILGKMQIYVTPDGTLRHKDSSIDAEDPINEPVIQEPAPHAPEITQPAADAAFQTIMDELLHIRQDVNSGLAHMNRLDARLASFETRVNSGFEGLNTLLTTGLESMDYRFDQLAFQQDDLTHDLQTISVRLDLMDASGSNDGGDGGNGG